MSARRIAIPLGLPALLAVALAIPALACPPSLSVERPANASSRDARDAFVLVHAYQGCHPGQLTVSGSAEGLVGGERRTIPLEVWSTETPGLYRVPQQWPRQGVWVLRLVVTVGDSHATALVGINASGQVTTVRQPARDGRVIRDPSDADVEALLRSLAA